MMSAATIRTAMATIHPVARLADDALPLAADEAQPLVAEHLRGLLDAKADRGAERPHQQHAGAHEHDADRHVHADDGSEQQPRANSSPSTPQRFVLGHQVERVNDVDGRAAQQPHGPDRERRGHIPRPLAFIAATIGPWP